MEIILTLLLGLVVGLIGGAFVTTYLILKNAEMVKFQMLYDLEYPDEEKEEEA